MCYLMEFEHWDGIIDVRSVKLHGPSDLQTCIALQAKLANESGLTLKSASTDIPLYDYSGCAPGGGHYLYTYYIVQDVTPIS